MATRYKRVREKMAENNLDVLLVHGSIGLGNSPGQVNLQYLTGYAAVVETYLVVPVDREPTMFLAVPFHVKNALDISYVKDIRPGFALYNVAERIKELKCDESRIGLVGPGATSGAGVTMFLENFQSLKAMLPEATFENASNWFDDLRLFKSDEELAAIRKSARLNDLIMEDVIQYARPGLTNRDLRRFVDVMAARHGATYPFAHISAINMLDPINFYPEFYPTSRVVEDRSIVMTEFVFGFGNYWNKIWGSFFIGEPTDEYIKMFETAAAVYRDTVKNLKVGMTGREVNKFLEPVAKAGYEQPANCLVSGWNAMMTRPNMGTLPSSLSNYAAALDLDYQLEERLTFTIHVWVRIPDTNKGLWIGLSGVMTKDGFENFNRFPVDEIRIAGK